MPPKGYCPSCGGSALKLGPTLQGCGRCLNTWDDTALVTVQEQEAKPKPAPPEPERMIDGSVIGYRAWRIKGWALTGTGVNRAWVPGVNEATCDPGRDESGGFGGIAMYSAFGGLSGSGYRNHPAPAVGCHCGITALARFADQDEHWGADDVPGAIEAWSDETVDVPGPGDVADAAGVITADAVAEMYDVPSSVARPKPEPSHGGRFILHGTGFRAQYGKVVLLAVDDEWPSAKRAAVRALAAEHGADVCKRSHLEDAAKEHGQLVPDEMLEWAKDGEPPSPTGSRGSLNQQINALAAQVQVYSTSVSQLRSSFGAGQWATTTNTTARPVVSPGRKGIRETLGYPGPPAHGKYRRGDRVRDRNGDIWQCSKGGKPGVWDAEASGE